MNINYNLGNLAGELHLSKEQMQELIDYINMYLGEAVNFGWREEAHKELHGTRRQYLNGLQQPVQDKNSVIVALIGVMPNMIENGSPPFDMKEGFKNGPKVKNKKDGGWFSTVPFRWSTPEALGENEVFSNKLPKEVYNIVKGKVATKTSAAGVKRYGDYLKESELPKNLQGQRLVRPTIVGEKRVYGAYTHKSNIYSGIYKEQKTYVKATQSKYISFRRVSDKSDPNAWIHPGFIKRDLAEKAVSKIDIEAVVENAVDNFLKEVGI